MTIKVSAVKRLYVTDLDGTLLDNNGELSEYSKKHLQSMLDKGLAFTVASARSLKSIKKIMKDVNLTLPVISLNGGFVSEFKSNKHIGIHHIGRELSKELYKEIESFGVLISSFDAENQSLSYNQLTPGINDYLVDRKQQVGDDVLKKHFNDVSGQIMAFTVIDEKERIIALEEHLKDKFGEHIIVDAWEDMYYKPWYWLSIHSTLSTKANGIKVLLDHLEGRYDEVVVFGDQSNDLEMFKIADKCFAVENAVEEIKTQATDIIERNSEHGVVKKILLLEGGYNDIVFK